MIFLYILLGLVGLIVLFFGLSSILEKGAKNKAAERLEKAKDLFTQGEKVKAMEVLADAFYVPSSSEYTPETAKTAANVLEFLLILLKDMGVEKTESVKKLIGELQKITTVPVEVPESLTEPVEKLFQALNMGATRNMNRIMEMAEKGEIEVRESRDEDDFTSELGSEHNETVNKVGKLLLKGKTSEAIGVLTPLIPSADKKATATFLEQRAACYAMDKKYEKSIEDYKAILELFPSHSRTVENMNDVHKNMK